MSKNGIAYFASIIVTPMMTCLYSPEQFGTLDLLIFLGSLISGNTHFSFPVFFISLLMGVITWNLELQLRAKE